MGVEKILNTSHSLYGNINRAVSGDHVLPKMVALKGGVDTALQSYPLVYTQAEVGLTFTMSQGITRDATHWFAISTTSIKKYDLVNNEVASNPSPFTSLPVGVDHCGDGFVLGAFLYVPIVDWDGGTQTSTKQCIVKFNISDLTYDSHFDVSAQSACNGSGLAVSPDELEIYASSFFNGVITDPRSTDIYRFDISTGAFLGVISLDAGNIGTQGFVFDGVNWFFSSWDSVSAGRIVAYNTSFEQQTILDPTGSSSEMEGICFYDDVVYFHDAVSTVRRLILDDMVIGKFVGDGDQFLDNGLIGDSGTILLRLTPLSLYNFNSLITMSEDPQAWESWIYSDGRIAWRVDEASFIIAPIGTATANTEIIIGLTWSNSGGTVTTKLNTNGVARGTTSGAWVTPPALGLWLGAATGGNTQGDASFRDVLSFNKELSDTELLDAANDFDDFYVTGVIPPPSTGVNNGGFPFGLMGFTDNV